MLRDLKSPFLRTLLRTFKVTASGGSASASLNANDFSAVASPGAGIATLALHRASHRSGGTSQQLAFASIETSGSYGGYYIDHGAVDMTASTVRLRGRSEAGTATDGIPMHGLTVGWESPDTARYSVTQRVLTTLPGMRVLGFRITSANAIGLGGNHATLTALATGDRQLTLARPFAKTPTVLVCPISTTQKAAQVQAVSASSVRIISQDSSESAADIDCYVLVIGQDSTSESSVLTRSPIASTQRRPRLVAASFSNVGAIDLGAGDATAVQNGTGDYTVSFTYPFKQEPIVLVMGRASRAQCYSTATTSSVRVLTTGATGSAQSDIFQILAIGSDDAVEY